MFFTASKALGGRTAYQAETFAAPDSPRPVEAGSYLTDGRALYRVVAPLHWATHQELSLLEDCATLEVHAFTGQELAGASLRPVAPSPASASR